jgi:penicillin-insensitive murein endopeptidase
MSTPSAKYKAFFAAVLLLPLGWTAMAGATALVNPWAEIDQPLAGPARVIGGYTAGCLQGAESLAVDEGPFQLMRKSRQRYFAHPDMRRFVKRLAAEVNKAQYGTLLVGDISQARGGPSTSGHASHQIGLDADFWFWLDSAATERRLSPAEEENLSALSMLNEKQTAVDPGRFRDKHVKLLQFVTAQPEVARVFVHPLIKKTLCERTEQAAWLSKIRPWWGHHYHFHVRLGCPDQQPDCSPQQPPGPEPGCGADLDWWFSREAAEQARKNQEEYRKSTAEQRLAKKLARVPQKCQAVLQP